jgi:hypothetical protein
MRDYQMFSSTGNAAVGGIVDTAEANFETLNEAWEWAADELIALGSTSTYCEADDTAVREAVWEALKAAFPVPTFKTVRA